MYQKVCLQTGENVVLLTVFVNVKDGSSDEATTDKFADGKALVARWVVMKTTSGPTRYFITHRGTAFGGE